MKPGSLIVLKAPEDVPTMLRVQGITLWLTPLGTHGFVDDVCKFTGDDVGIVVTVMLRNNQKTLLDLLVVCNGRIGWTSNTYVKEVL